MDAPFIFPKKISILQFIWQDLAIAGKSFNWRKKYEYQSLELNEWKGGAIEEGALTKIDIFQNGWSAEH